MIVRNMALVRFGGMLLAFWALTLALGACSAATPSPTPTTPPTPTAPRVVATPTATTAPSAQATPTPTKAAGPAPTATTPSGDGKAVDYRNLIGSIECPLCPEGMAEAYPLMAKYHWSKLPNPTGLKPKPGGVLRLPLNTDVDHWDHLKGISATFTEGSSIWSRLMVADHSVVTAFKTKGVNMQQLVAVCDLCESWEQKSPTEYVFHLRKNVFWHDIPPVSGRQLKASDVVWSFEQYLDPKAFQQFATFTNVESVTAPDDFTVVIKTKNVYPGLIANLTHTAFPVVAKETFDRPGGYGAEPPIGTGAFVFKEHQTSVKLETVRNPRYFKTDAYGQQLPYFDAIQRFWVKDNATRLALWRSNQIDMTDTRGDFTIAEDLLRSEQLGKTAYVYIMEPNTGGVGTVFIQLNRPPFNDVRVRRAMAMALDREEMLDFAYGEGGFCGYAMPTFWFGRDYPAACDDHGPWWKADTEKAKALLKEAGYGSLSVDFHVLSPPSNLQQAAQQQWKKAGIEVRLVPHTSAELTALQRTKEWDGLLASGLGAGTDLDIYAFKLHSTSGENYSHINDPELDKIIEAQRVTLDVQKRRELGAQVRARELDQVYFLWPGSSLFTEWTRPYIRNAASHQLYYYTNGWGLKAMEEAWFDK